MDKQKKNYIIGLVKTAKDYTKGRWTEERSTSYGSEPVPHIDAITWEEKEVSKPAKEARSELKEILEQDSDPEVKKFVQKKLEKIAKLDDRKLGRVRQVGSEIIK